MKSNFNKKNCFLHLTGNLSADMLPFDITEYYDYWHYFYFLMKVYFLNYLFHDPQIRFTLLLTIIKEETMIIFAEESLE